MSQVVEADRVDADDPEEFDAVAAPPAKGTDAAAGEFDTFDYKPVPVLAPLSVVFAVCSIFAWWLMPAVGIALLGLVIGAVAVRKIAASEGELGGMRLAMIGFVGSLVLFCGSLSKHAFVIATEVPEGYTKIHFVRDVSQYPIGQKRGQILIPKPVAELVDQKVFLKGYMWQTEHKEGLTSFLLVKDNQVCCFGPGEIKPTDMVLVELADGQTFDLTTSMVSVAGTFELVQPKPGEEMLTNGAHPIVYRLDATHVEVSKTAF